MSWGITHVDFWVLDVEGAELEVLRVFDFAAVSVDVVVVEVDRTNQAKDDAVRAVLRASGYRRHDAADGTKAGQRSDWFVREGFVPSAAP